MRRAAGSQRRDERGFTLIELLAVISILGIVSFALTEAVILGLKTTDAVTTDVARSAGVQALRSYFTGDAQRAKQASTGDTTCATSAPGMTVVLHLYWTDQSAAREVAYSLEDDGAAIAGQSELVRRTCTAAGVTLDKRRLGLIEFDPAGPPPLRAQCDDAPCPAALSAPSTITLTILTNRSRDPSVPVDLTVRRRTT